MLKNSIKVILVLVIFYILTGCSAKGPIFVKTGKASGSISADSYEIKFQDKRTSIDNRSINIPFATMLGNSDMVHPVIDSDKVRSIAGNVVEKFLTYDPGLIIVQVNILDAYQKFHATATAEIEYVFVKVEIVVKNKSNKRIIHSAKGEAWGELSSMDASVEQINEMLNMAIERSVFEALLKM